MPEQLKNELIEQFRVRVFGESFSRIKICLEKLSEEQVWQAPNKSSNSVGNLILHLIGNGRQWIFSGLMDQKDDRNRAAEFEKNSACPKSELLQMMADFEKDCEILYKASIDLIEIRNVQVFQESGVSILVHVIEHMSYHTGQIALLTKLMVNEDLGFYGGMDLD